MKLLISFIVLFLCSCSDPQKIQDAPTEDAGTLPDGRVIKHIKRAAGNNTIHHIYYVENPDGGTTISTNQPHGKYRKTVVLIDGVEYAPIEK